MVNPNLKASHDLSDSSSGPTLYELFDYFWLFEGGQVHRRERIVQSGTIEFVINLPSEVVRIHADSNLRCRSDFRVSLCRNLFERFVIDAMKRDFMLGAQ